MLRRAAILTGITLLTSMGIAIPAAHAASGPSSPTTRTTTVTGTVSDGVEAGCLILTADRVNKTYLLLGGDRKVLTPGAHVQVTGELPTDIATYCMQGTELLVRSAETV